MTVDRVGNIETDMPEPGQDADTEELQADIEQTRDAVTDADGKTVPAVRVGAPAGLVALAVVVGLVVWRRRR